MLECLIEHMGGKQRSGLYCSCGLFIDIQIFFKCENRSISKFTVPDMNSSRYYMIKQQTFYSQFSGLYLKAKDFGQSILLTAALRMLRCTEIRGLYTNSFYGITPDYFFNTACPVFKCWAVCSQ